MKLAPYILLSETAFGINNENYDGIATTFSGNAVRGASHYYQTKDQQTFSWQLNNFVGYLIIEATLETDPATPNYFEVANIGDGITAITESTSLNVIGNFTWVRVSVVNFASGTITEVAVTY